MATTVEVSPGLPQSVEPGPHAGSISALVMRLTDLLTKISLRANDAIQKDGSNRMAAPLQLYQVDTAGRPNPADWPGSAIWVTDAGAGNELQVSDGSSWVSH